MKRIATAVALVASLSLALTPALGLAAPPYVKNSTGTTANGQLDALTDIYYNTLGVAQASTTSGQTGPLVMCAAETSAPTLLNAKTYPCSLTLSGALRVDGSGVTQPVSISGTISLPTGAATSANQTSELARLPAALSTAGYFKTAGDGVDDNTSVGGSATSAAVLSNGPFSTAGFGGGHIDWTITSTGTGVTLVLEATQDGTTWYSVPAVSTQAIGGTPSTSITNSTAVNYQSPVTGAQMRWRASAYSSGTVTVVGTLRRAAVNMIGYNQNVTSSTGTSAVFVQGADAQGASVAGRPVVTGCQARTSSITAVTNAQATTTVCTVSGIPIMRMNTIPENEWTANISLSDTTSTALHASCGAGLKNYVTWYAWSSVATTTAVTLTLLDGASAKLDDDVAAGAGRGGNGLPTPLQGSAATAFNAQLSGSPTGAVKVRAGGYCAP